MLTKGITRSWIEYLKEIDHDKRDIEMEFRRCFDLTNFVINLCEKSDYPELIQMFALVIEEVQLPWLREFLRMQVNCLQQRAVFQKVIYQ